MNQAQITRRNHYVPIWYQKGFFLGSRSKLQYLDFDPRTELPNGRVIVRRGLELRSPRRCFMEWDLYTTRFGGRLNDNFEKFLFGGIDAEGARAVQAFVGGNPKVIHDCFQSFFGELYTIVAKRSASAQPDA